MTGYERLSFWKKTINEEHKKQGIPKIYINDLLVMSPQNDPFYCGMAAQVEQGKWFAELWNEFGFGPGTHLRRIHYKILSCGHKKSNSMLYENTENDWLYLCSASKYARYLNLVPEDSFIDAKNPDPILFAEQTDNNNPSCQSNFSDWYLPSIDINLSNDINLKLPDIDIDGYYYSKSKQPYHLEIWIEKSTMNDVLMPICQQYGINLICGTGFLSITAVTDLIERVKTIDKPCRIFYICDFDPAGDNMAQSVARQIEYWVQQKEVDCNIKLNQIALTKKQVKEYQLPRIPIKDTDIRKNNFETTYGEGATELDALEALYPGTLKQIVVDAITPYYDSNLENEYDNAYFNAKEIIEKTAEEYFGEYQNQINDLEEKARTVYVRYQEQLNNIKFELDQELGPLQDRLKILQQVIRKRLDQLTEDGIDIPELPASNCNPNDNDWLFDNKRDYMDQLSYYKARKTS